MREEVALARAETQQKIRHAMRQVALIAIGGVLLLAGAIEVLAVLNRGLTALLDGAVGLETAAWLSPLIFAIIFLAVGAAILKRSVDHLKTETRPERTVSSLKETKRWATRRARTARRSA